MAPLFENDFYLCFLRLTHIILYSLSLYFIWKKINGVKIFNFYFLKLFFWIFLWAYKFLLELELLIKPKSYVTLFGLCLLFDLLHHPSNLTLIRILVYLIMMARNRLNQHYLSFHYLGPYPRYLIRVNLYSITAFSRSR